MGDFYQNGIVTTLHNLRCRDLEDLEKELVEFSHVRPMSLVLPSLYSELEGPALSHIVDELSDVPYLSEIIIGLDRADQDQYLHAREFFSRLPQPNVRILWNDGPRLQAIHKKLEAQDLAPTELGKGRNVWYCMGYMLASGRGEAVALHDCDILTYKREMLARLIYPIANPNFNYEYAKGFYSRIGGDKMGGRVTRLLVTPLIRALKKVIGHSEWLDYLDSFRYPLAGEFAMRRDVVNDIRIPSDWGLEVGLLLEIKRNFANNRICQVDIADTYDHKHQELSLEDAEKGLSKMSVDISKSIFRKLATNGAVFTPEIIRSIKATYFRVALDFVETYRNDALINGLGYDVHTEERSVELFAKNIVDAGNHFLENPMDTPFVPSWNRVISAQPDILTELRKAVEEDHQEYSPGLFET
ncbi:MAG: glycosyl transferase [Porticoccaceae bacterium]|nr:glycosyl transferase [Porticoccaceae bacterium]